MRGTLVFNSSSEIINQNPQSGRAFIGFDGRAYVSDNLGTRRASGAALALLAINPRRADGYRDEVAND